MIYMVLLLDIHGRLYANTTESNTLKAALYKAIVTNHVVFYSRY